MYSSLRVGAEYPSLGVGAKYPSLRVGAEYPSLRVNAEYLPLRVGAEYPSLRVGAEYPSLLTSYPWCSAVQPRSPLSASPVSLGKTIVVGIVAECCSSGLLPSFCLVTGCRWLQQ